jgi:hypothetical protein
MGGGDGVVDLIYLTSLPSLARLRRHVVMTFLLNINSHSDDGTNARGRNETVVGCVSCADNRPVYTAHVRSLRVGPIKVDTMTRKVGKLIIF